MKLLIDQSGRDDIHLLVEEEGEMPIRDQIRQLIESGMSQREAKREIRNRYPISEEQMEEAYKKGEVKIN